MLQLGCPLLPAWALRVLCLVLAGLAGIWGLAIYRSAEDLDDIYDGKPHQGGFLQDGRIAVIAVLTPVAHLAPLGNVFAFAWNFVQLVLLFFMGGLRHWKLLCLMGLVDLAIGIAIFVAYIAFVVDDSEPHGACHDDANRKSGTDGGKLTAAPGLGNPDNYTSSVCQMTSVFWALTIVVTCFSIAYGFMCLLIGCAWGLDYLIVRLPASVRFSWRCISKYQERRKRTHHNTGLSEKGVSERRTRPRLPLELLIMIAEYLHHADLVSLSRSSKRLRRAFFDDEDPRGVMDRLQQYTCGDPAALPKTACVVCRCPICRDCRDTVEVPRPVALNHLTRCLPACSRCFFNKCCVSKRWSGRARSQRDVESLGETSRRGEGHVCRMCGALSTEDKTAIMERSWAREAQRVQSLRLACYVCNRTLPETGMRWWIDAMAGEECRWEGHPGWIARGTAGHV